jgi:hypothetical protein
MFLHDVLGPQMWTSGQAPTSTLRVSLRTLDARIPSCAPVRAAFELTRHRPQAIAHGANRCTGGAIKDLV